MYTIAQKRIRDRGAGGGAQNNTHGLKVDKSAGGCCSSSLQPLNKDTSINRIIIIIE